MPSSGMFVAFFEEFYEVLIGQKRLVLTTDGGGDLGSEELAQNVLQTLAGVLERQSLEAYQRGGAFMGTAYLEAQYLMASLADELFLSFRWKGAHYWEQNLLEEKLFRSHTAGETVFENIAILLRDRDPIKNDMAKLYLIVLGLGFRGQYRGVDDGGAIAHLKEQLFLFINRTKPSLFEGKEALFPEALEPLAEGSLAAVFPNARPWSWFLVGIISLYVVFSHLFWLASTSKLNGLVNSVLVDISQMGGEQR